MQVIKSTKRATYVGIAALVAVVVAVGLGLAGVYSGSETKTKQLADVVDNVKDGIVYVRTESPATGSIGRGTAWVWDLGQGLLVTNAHVTEGAESINVGFKGQLQPAELVSQAPCEDLAVIKIQNTAGLKKLKVGDQSQLKIGTPVAAVGYPGSVNQARDFDQYDLTGTDGTVSIPKTYVGNLQNIVATTAQINSGQSGGPLVNLDEEVVGVTSLTTFAADKGDIENGAIGIDRVKEIVPRLAAGEQIC
jgi:S1-C subfamily serine protease